VSNDVRFVQHILGSTVNGTTYAGIRARTTGASSLAWQQLCQAQSCRSNSQDARLP
jgi:1-pyrroline-5-carboxylate dehydrogenase